MNVPATKVFTSRGEVFITERGEDACCESEEISAVDVEVPAGTTCDICGEEIEGED